MKNYTDPKFAESSSNQLSTEEQSAENQRAGVSLGSRIISRFFNTMLGKITDWARSVSEEFNSIFAMAALTPSSSRVTDLRDAIVKIIDSRATGLHVGDLIPNLGNQPIPGRAIPDGSILVNCKTIYPDFYTYVIANTPYVNYTVWQNQVDLYGQCGFCGVNGDDVKLPLITRPISGVESLAQCGTAIMDTMRPITGSIGNKQEPYVFEGAFYPGPVRGGVGRNYHSDTTQTTSFDSGRLGARYNGSETRGKQVLYPYHIVLRLSGTGGGSSSASVWSVNGRVGVVTLSKADVSLSNVDNTSDLDKPISTATQTALNGKVDKVAGKGLSTDDFVEAPDDTNTYAKKSRLWTIIDAFINGVSLLGKNNSAEDLGLQSTFKAGNNITKTQVSESAIKLHLQINATSPYITDISPSPLTFNYTGSSPIISDGFFTDSTKKAYGQRQYFSYGIKKPSGADWSKLKFGTKAFTLYYIIKKDEGTLDGGTLWQAPPHPGYSTGTIGFLGDFTLYIDPANSTYTANCGALPITDNTVTLFGITRKVDGGPVYRFKWEKGGTIQEIDSFPALSNTDIDFSNTYYDGALSGGVYGTTKLGTVVMSARGEDWPTNLDEFPVNTAKIKDVIACKNYFGEIYTADNTTAQTIPTGATYTKATAFNTAGEYRGVTLDAANNKIILPSAGYYKVNVTASSKLGSAGITLESALFLNGVKVPNCQAIRKVNNANDESTVSFGGIVKVDTANSEIDIRVSQSSGSDVSLTTVFCNLNVTYEGDLTL